MPPVPTSFACRRVSPCPILCGVDRAHRCRGIQMQVQPTHHVQVLRHSGPDAVLTAASSSLSAVAPPGAPWSRPSVSVHLLWSPQLTPIVGWICHLSSRLSTLPVHHSVARGTKQSAFAFPSDWFHVMHRWVLPSHKIPALTQT